MSARRDRAHRACFRPAGRRGGRISSDRRLRAAGRLQLGCPGLARRIDRVAVSAALRQPRRVRSDPRSRRRALVDPTRGRVHSGAPLPARNARRRDYLHDRRRCRAPARLHGVRGGTTRARPRARRAARGAPTASRATRARSRWPWNSRLAASTGWSSRCSARRATADVPSAAPTGSGFAPGFRWRSPIRR